MAARGHDITIFGGAGDIGRPAVERVRVRTYPYVDRDRFRALRPLARQYTLTKLLERLSMLPAATPALLRGGFDIVHIQKPYDLPVGALSKLTGARLLFGCHGKDFWPTDRFWAQAADGAVAASKYNASQVEARYGISPTVVYNGVDLERFRPEGEFDRKLLEDLGLQAASDQSPVLLYAARLVRWKGLEYLIRALPETRPDGTRLWVAGEGPYRAQLERLAREVGVASRITFLGRVDQDTLAALYRSATMLVATSFVNETFGMALCEAMACGTPVVATDFGGFREVVSDGLTGLLVRAQDPKDLAWKINILLSDKALRTKLGAEGRNRVQRDFTWAAVADRIEEVYKWLVPSSM